MGLNSIIPSPELSTEQKSIINNLCSWNPGQFSFVTGRAGTGKSTILREFTQSVQLKTIVLAPTGLASIQIGGQTIHSFFLFPFGPLTNSFDQVPVFRKGHPKSKILNQIEAIVIDEISMVRADILDAIDFSLRQNVDAQLPFGGKSIIAFGDLRQLEPVVQSGSDSQMIQDRFASPFFFDAVSLRNYGIDVYELTQIFRQNDEDFLFALEQIRKGNSSELGFLNDRVGASLDHPHPIILTATNRRADTINLQRLNGLPGPARIYKGEIIGDYNKDFPTDPLLGLKLGAQVMTIKNGRQFVNGTMGKIVELDHDMVRIQLANGQIVDVEPDKWDKNRYTWNSIEGTIGKEVVGSYVQLPLKLAWAVTVHKSQGLTLDAAIIDMDVKGFAHGQVYVALSRCRSISDISLVRPIEPEDIVINSRIEDFESMAGLT